MNLAPAGIGHWDAPTEPSIFVVPFWNMPWKCRLVDWLPKLLTTLTTSWSPFVAYNVGGGHWPFTPITLLATPLGLAVIQEISKSYVVVLTAVLRTGNSATSAAVKRPLAIMANLKFFKPRTRSQLIQCSNNRIEPATCG